MKDVTSRMGARVLWLILLVVGGTLLGGITSGAILILTPTSNQADAYVALTPMPAGVREALGTDRASAIDAVVHAGPLQDAVLASAADQLSGLTPADLRAHVQITALAYTPLTRISTSTPHADEAIGMVNAVAKAWVARLLGAYDAAFTDAASALALRDDALSREIAATQQAILVGTTNCGPPLLHPCATSAQLADLQARLSADLSEQTTVRSAGTILEIHRAQVTRIAYLAIQASDDTVTTLPDATKLLTFGVGIGFALGTLIAFWLARQPVRRLVASISSGDINVQDLLDPSLERLRRVGASITWAGTAFVERTAPLVSWITSEWALAIVVSAVSLAVFSHEAGNISLWFDESYSVILSGQPLPLLWTYIWGHELHMGFYYLLLRGWIGLGSLFGVPPTELMVRLPSIVSMALAAAVVFGIGLRVRGRMTGIIAGVGFALNELVLIEAQATRSYAMQVLFVCLSWYVLLNALTTRSPRRGWWWTAYTICTALAIYLQIFSMLILAAQLVLLAGLLILPGTWRESARRAWRDMATSLIALLILCVPLFLDALTHGGANSWVPPATPGRLREFFLLLNGYDDRLLQLNIAACLLALLVTTLTLLPSTQRLIARLARPDGRDNLRMPNVHVAESRPGVAALACWFLVPSALAYVTTQPQLNLHLFDSTYLVVVAPAFCLLIALGITALPWTSLQAPVAAALLLLTLQHTILEYYHLNREPWHDPALWLEQRYQTGDGIICAPRLHCAVNMQYYLATYPSAAHLNDDSPGNWNWRTDYESTPLSGPSARAYASQHRRIFVVSILPNDAPPTAPDVVQLNTILASLSELHFQHVAQYSSQAPITHVTVYLYEAAPQQAVPAG